MTAVILLVLILHIFSQVNGKGTIDFRLQQRYIRGGSRHTENVLVSFTQSIQTVFDQIETMQFSSQDEKREVLTVMQEVFTDNVQGDLKEFLTVQRIKFESFWICNRMIVSNANYTVASKIANYPGVLKVQIEPMAYISYLSDKSEDSKINVKQSNVQWGIQRIRANSVWKNYTGRGVVVSAIDTGVRHTHEAIQGRWRSSYGWYDAYNKTSNPLDDHGHGTHVIGTMAGKYGIGVSPEATYIVCKGCSSRACGGAQLYSCGQWIQCPTDPNGKNRDCRQAPNVVSNSWVSQDGERAWYDDVISSWQYSGIVPVFGIGNSGPECKTAVVPGERRRVIGVGNIEENERISTISSLGPSSEGRIKPDIVAPGARVWSAWNTTDQSYKSLSGASMACPHVSGVIALMKQKKPSITYNQIYEIITGNAITNLDTRSARTCDGKNGTSFPNNVFGYGRIDALNSVNAINV